MERKEMQTSSTKHNRRSTPIRAEKDAVERGCVVPSKKKKYMHTGERNSGVEKRMRNEFQLREKDKEEAAAN